MNPNTEVFSMLSSLTTDSVNSADDHSVTVHDQYIHNLVSSSYNKLSDNSMNIKSIITELGESPKYTSNPENLAKLQNYISEYSNYIALVSSLARKGVNIVETLGKSQ